LSKISPSSKLIYVGDTDEKWSYFDNEALAGLGIRIKAHGKMADVVVHNIYRNWLVLIESVTSHGPVDPKRHNELKSLFSDSSVGLVFVTASLNRKALIKYLDEIAWETEVWVAESPGDMIYFNGERFLGPYYATALPRANTAICNRCKRQIYLIYSLLCIGKRQMLSLEELTELSLEEYPLGDRNYGKPWLIKELSEENVEMVVSFKLAAGTEIERLING
jgi:hypothetical protein